MANTPLYTTQAQMQLLSKPTESMRAPLRPRLMRVLRAAVEPSEEFDLLLDRANLGTSIRWDTNGVKWLDRTFNWLLPVERAHDLVSAEWLEHFVSRGLWPMSWLDGRGPVWRHWSLKAGTWFEIDPLPSFAELVSVASMLLVVLLAIDIGQAAYRDYYAALSDRARARAPATLPLAIDGVSRLSDLALMSGAQATKQSLPCLEGYGFTLRRERTLLTMQVPCPWYKGNLTPALVFSRWLQASGIDEHAYTYVAP